MVSLNLKAVVQSAREELNRLRHSASSAKSQVVVLRAAAQESTVKSLALMAKVDSELADGGKHDDEG